jgi:hypothetical protein
MNSDCLRQRFRLATIIHKWFYVFSIFPSIYCLAKKTKKGPSKYICRCKCFFQKLSFCVYSFTKNGILTGKNLHLEFTKTHRNTTEGYSLAFSPL